jgi:hypothetical protein
MSAVINLIAGWGQRTQEDQNSRMGVLTIDQALNASGSIPGGDNQAFARKIYEESFRAEGLHLQRREQSHARLRSAADHLLSNESIQKELRERSFDPRKTRQWLETLYPSLIENVVPDSYK